MQEFISVNVHHSMPKLREEKNAYCSDTMHFYLNEIEHAVVPESPRVTLCGTYVLYAVRMYLCVRSFLY